MISSTCLALIVIPAIYALTKSFLNRAIRSLIENAGFQFDRYEAGYMPGPKPMTFMYEGVALPR